MKKIMRKVTLFFVFVIIVYPNYDTIAQTTAENGNLTVHIENLQHDKGQVIVNLFRKGDDIMGKPFLQMTGRIANGKAKAEIKDVPFAEYVIFAFHDENNNGTMDHNWLNFPKEPMGYSNNWNFSLTSGMPTYEKTKFTFSKESRVITITIK